MSHQKKNNIQYKKPTSFNSYTVTKNLKIHFPRPPPPPPHPPLKSPLELKYFLQ